uniref:Lipocalin/cytosolic fatty-acid binding domain-containing protein n=1 Tax=Alexandrium catenella TaxID=2925 RepID=A0A7S1PX67_ALECA
MARALLLSLLLSAAGASVSCARYEDLATHEAMHLDAKRYQGFWYEVAGVSGFIDGSCACTRMKFELEGPTSFKDTYTCRKPSPEGNIVLPPVRGSFPAGMPGKMEGPMKPVTMPYWVVGLWGDYEYSLVYSCAPLLVTKAERLYFFSRKPEIPAEVMKEMRAFAAARNLSLAYVKDVPMAGCKWAPDSGAAELQV